ncbi:MAG: phoR 3 [Acidobacteria bacterium]|nr:phoR 3 [Acidobacteriota bacterium]
MTRNNGLTRAASVRWFQSFYFRLAFSFVVFVVSLLIAQSAIFSLVIARRPFPNRAPNNVVAIVAADLGSALAQDPSLDVDAFLKREYGSVQPAYAVMKDGAIASNRTAPLVEEVRRSVEGVLAGKDPSRDGDEPVVTLPPFVMAPIQVGGELRGIAVLPPAFPGNPVARDVARLLSVPGTGLLVLATVLAAVFIFEPSRRRLKALQHASRRLGAGDLSARVPVTGSDEIADVAATFNSMAAALAERDQALRTVERLRAQMLADVSHELRTPLTAMRGYVETLHIAGGSLDAETRERYFATLERETYRLDRIVKDLLDLARFENGAADLEIRDFAIRRLFEHVLDRHRQEILKCGLSVEVSVSDAADQIGGDPGRIEQVIDNLFANALKHTPDRGRIALSAAIADGRAVLAVANTGAAIPAEHIAHLFERFYKADQARVNAEDGSGLGLSIAKAIVERHRGTIDVVSESGRTIFSVSLPHDPPIAGRGHASSTNL